MLTPARASRVRAYRWLTSRGARAFFAPAHPGGFPLQTAVIDFLDPNSLPPFVPDWVIFNPPFDKALDCTLRALEVAKTGVAMLGRTYFWQSTERYKRLFSPHPLTVIGPFEDRIGQRVVVERIVRNDNDVDSGRKTVWKPAMKSSSRDHQQPSSGPELRSARRSKAPRCCAKCRVTRSASLSTIAHCMAAL